jgi:hypothetical protein
LLLLLTSGQLVPGLSKQTERRKQAKEAKAKGKREEVKRMAGNKCGTESEGRLVTAHKRRGSLSINSLPPNHTRVLGW